MDRHLFLYAFDNRKIAHSVMCSSDEAAKDYGRRGLEHFIAVEKPARASCSVGRSQESEEPGVVTGWLGTWDWSADDGFTWTPAKA